MRVFLLDAHDIVRRGLAYLLARHSIELVGEAATAQQALDRIPGASPDVLVLDLNLGESQPWFPIHVIRQQHADLPILVLSMMDDPDMVRRAIEHGAHGYLVKSSTEEELVTGLRIVAAGGAYFDPRIARHALSALRTGGQEELQVSERARTLLKYLARGLSNREIALAMHVSLGTVKAQLAHLYALFDTTSRTTLVTEAMRRGLVGKESP